MRCPKCPDIDLVRARLDGAPHRLRHVPSVCPRCDGLWVHLDTITSLVELGDQGVAGPVDRVMSPRTEGGADSRTGLCPEGHGLLTRAPVPGVVPDSPSFWLERCATCDGVFFDTGEWHALARRRLLGDLRLLWNESWRRDRRRERAHDVERRWLEETLGSDLLTRLNALGAELREHPSRSAALAHLGRVAGVRD